MADNSAAIVAAVPPGGSTTTYGMAYAYDALNRLTGTIWDPVPAATAPTAGPLVTFGHTYNKVNQRTGQTVDDSTWLSYPASPATTAYTANTLNQYTAVGATTPTYDGNGNLTSDGTYTLGYDLENRMTSASGAGNTAAYAFDAQGRRKSRTVNGTTTISVTDADNREVLEYNGGTGTLLRWYAYGLGPNAVLNQMNIAGGTRETVLLNLQGSIIASFASSSGALTRFDYQPYGNSAAAATPFGYTGQRFDQESGLYYYRARHYSPRIGRFTQVDPTGGANLYGYVGNDPLNVRDPRGLAGQSNYDSGWGGSSYGGSPAPYTDQSSFGGSSSAVTPVSYAEQSSPGPSFPSGTQTACVPACAAPIIPPILEALGIGLSAGVAGIGLGAAIDSLRNNEPVVYHRLESPTQTAETAMLQQQSGEVWGATPRGGFTPTVQAFRGALPGGERGINTSRR